MRLQFRDGFNFPLCVDDQRETRERLIQALNRLGSRRLSERAAAAAAVDRLAEELAIDWRALLAYPVPQSRGPRSWRELVTECLNCDCLLGDNQIDFLKSLARFPHLSDRQLAALERIAKSIGVPTR